MRSIYGKYREQVNLQPLVGEIGIATYAVLPRRPEAYREQLSGPEAIAERRRLWDAEYLEMPGNIRGMLG